MLNIFERKSKRLQDHKDLYPNKQQLFQRTKEIYTQPGQCDFWELRYKERFRE